jgi:hypothetical protein
LERAGERRARPDGCGVTWSRHELLKRAGVGVGAFAVGGASARAVMAAASAPSAQQDAKILNFALMLERLQAGFYRTAIDHGVLKGELREFAEVVGENERAHVAFLVRALGPHAKPSPAFNFAAARSGQRTFATTARMLEDAGVYAYNGQAANLTRPVLGAAAEIVSVEGRHAAWIRDILGLEPAPHPADVGVDASAIIAQLRANGLLR